MTDFAKAQLLKYGWTEGKGLGKNENGITKALKPKLKFNTTGVGHKDKDYNEWWETAFNKAANNIVVESQNHGVAISVSKETSSNELLQTHWSEKKSNRALSYGSFLKTSTLLNGNLITESNSNTLEAEVDEKGVLFTPLTDEELFKVCGGRTAHKGARHGLTLSGKLKRIAQQEKDLLGMSTFVDVLDTLKKQNNFQRDEYGTDNDEDTTLPLYLKEDRKVSKNCRKKSKRRINNLSHQLNILCNVNENDKESNHTCNELLPKEKLKHKRKGQKEKRDTEVNDTVFSVTQKLSEENENDLTQKKKKKAKKKRKEKYQDGSITDILESEGVGASQAKKLKISHNSNVNSEFFANDPEINTLEYKFQTELSCSDVSVKSGEVRDSFVDLRECNSEILDKKLKTSKLKKAKLREKEKELVTNTDSLGAVHFGFKESPKESISEPSNKYYKHEADYLNAKIAKKKKSKHNRKGKIKLTNTTESLEAALFDTEEYTGKRNSKKKLAAIVDAMVIDDIVVNKSKHLKKAKNKKKNNKINKEC